MYGEVVDGVDGHLFEDAITASEGNAAASSPMSISTADDLEELIGHLPARSTHARQVGSAFRRMHASSSGARTGPSSTPGRRRARRSTGARTRSRTTSAPPCNVVQMVFGNKGDARAPASASRAIPSTGRDRLYGEFLVNAQGEDVVAGIRTPEPIAADARAAPRGLRRS